jgi:5-formyltetrahydrofolate cyclo-ligase
LTKDALRKTIKTRLAAISPEEFAAAGREAARNVQEILSQKSHPLLGNNTISSVLIFLSMRDEIDTKPLIEAALSAKKRVFVPKVEGQLMDFFRLRPADNPGRMLTMDDFPALILTPGLAFDRQGRRLGRGKGYYDRFFAVLDSVQMAYTAIGLCMDCQLSHEIPVEPHDKLMHGVLTERELYFP